MSRAPLSRGDTHAAFDAVDEHVALPYSRELVMALLVVAVLSGLRLLSLATRREPLGVDGMLAIGALSIAVLGIAREALLQLTVPDAPARRQREPAGETATRA